MGFSEFIASAKDAIIPPPPPVPPKTEADPDRSKDEVIRRLTQELVMTRERNHDLERRQLQETKSRKEVIDRVRELEDVIALKNGMFDSLERQLALLEKHTAELQRKEAELIALRAEQAEQPISANDLAHRFEQLSDLFTQLQDTLTCPVCYEPFGRGQAVSLQCGHTFCQACYTEWEQRHVEAFKNSPRQGVYTGPECPECRTADVRRGRVRIYSLEEVVRLVERGKREIAAHPYTPADVKPIEPITAAQLLLQEQAEMQDDDQTDVETASRQSETETPVEAEIKAADQGGNGAWSTGRDADDEQIDIADAITSGPLDASSVFEATMTAGQAAASCDAPMDSPAPSAQAPVPIVDIQADQPDQPVSPDQAAPFQQGVTRPAEADADTAAEADVVLPDASRLSLEETYLRERAAARLRAREEELRLEMEAAARRAEEEEREAREAREQLLVERGRRPYAVGAVSRSE